MNENFSIYDNRLEINLDTFWQEVQEKISREMTAISFDVWIKTLEPVSLQQNTLVVSTPSASSKNVVLNNYKTLIEQKMQEVHPAINKLDVVISTEEELIKEESHATASVKVLETPTVSQDKKSMFNPKYTFDTFVVGSSNQFAVAAAKAVAENPGKNYNPLFIYGGVGLGKTHILHAIGNYIQQTHPELNVIYVTIEQFTNDLIASIQTGNNSSQSDFRKKYRTADVLIVDDIQFIINKTSVQEEFFHTFNELNQAGKQIIISSDKPPKEIYPLEERLRSRFEWGLLADIGYPSLETRIAILNKKAELERMNVSKDVITYIAESVTTNIREMESLLARAVFYAGLMGKSVVTIETAHEALKNYIVQQQADVGFEHILECVSKYFNINIKELTSRKRNKEIVSARQISMYLITEMLSMPLAAIGQIFGKDHATVLYAKNKIEEDMKKNKKLKIQVNDIKQMIAGK